MTFRIEITQGKKTKVMENISFDNRLAAELFELGANLNAAYTPEGVERPCYRVVEGEDGAKCL